MHALRAIDRYRSIRSVNKRSVARPYPYPTPQRERCVLGVSQTALQVRPTRPDPRDPRDACMRRKGRREGGREAVGRSVSQSVGRSNTHAPVLGRTMNASRFERSSGRGSLSERATSGGVSFKMGPVPSFTPLVLVLRLQGCPAGREENERERERDRRDATLGREAGRSVGRSPAPMRPDDVCRRSLDGRADRPTAVRSQSARVAFFSPQPVS